MNRRSFLTEILTASGLVIGAGPQIVTHGLKLVKPRAVEWVPNPEWEKATHYIRWIGDPYRCLVITPKEGAVIPIIYKRKAS